jgi:uncharacterized membrane protein HdeD (DUF308 family)
VVRLNAGGEDHLRSQVTASGVVPVVVLVVLVGLLLAALGAFALPGRWRRLAAVLLVPVSAAWVVFNGPIEGPILLTFTKDHGVTVSDLLGVLGLAVALVVLRRGRRPLDEAAGRSRAAEQE